MNYTSPKTGRKKDWPLTQSAFEDLLRWLDQGTDSDGETYLAIRSRLVTFFDRKNCLSPDDLADETLNRVGRRLQEEGNLITEAPAKYCYTIARFVFLEHLRSPTTSEVPIEEIEQQRNPQMVNQDPDQMAERALHEAMLDCLEECVTKLDGPDRELIIGYYSGEKRLKIENRRRMAEKLGLSVNALSIRAFRVRQKLETCVKKCAGSLERK